MEGDNRQCQPGWDWSANLPPIHIHWVRQRCRRREDCSYRWTTWAVQRWRVPRQELPTTTWTYVLWESSFDGQPLKFKVLSNSKACNRSVLHIGSENYQ